MARTVTYEVGVTFCTGRSVTHGIVDLGEATKEYSWMLAVAIDPSLATEIDAKHIRLVTLLGFDELGQVTQHVTSPVFPCEHRADDAA